MSASTVCGVGSRISISRLCVRISNCSRDFLSTWGDLSTVQRLILVGSGIGPDTFAPVRFAVSMISSADWSNSLWSYPFSRILIFCVTITFLKCLMDDGRPFASLARTTDARCFISRPSSIVPRFALLDHLGDNAGAHGPAALTDGEAKALVHRNRRDQLHAARHIVARHHHLDALGELHHSRHIRRPEIELRTVTVEERGVAAALFLRQDVRLRLELRLRRDAPRL